MFHLPFTENLFLSATSQVLQNTSVNVQELQGRTRSQTALYTVGMLVRENEHTAFLLTRFLFFKGKTGSVHKMTLNLFL